MNQLIRYVIKGSPLIALGIYLGWKLRAYDESL